MVSRRYLDMVDEIGEKNDAQHGDSAAPRLSKQTRRTHLKQLGAGIAGATGGLAGLTTISQDAAADHNVGFIDGGSHAATEDSDYPYEWSDGHSKVFDSWEDIKRAWNAGVKTWVVDGDYYGEARIGVEIFGGMSTRWVNPDLYDTECREVEGQNVEITFDSADSEDFVFRADDDWVGAHEFEGQTDMTFVSEAAKDFVGYGLDLMDDTIGTGYSVVMDTAEFASGLMSASSDNTSQDFQWNYVSDDTRVFSGKKDSETSTYFEVYLDPDQRVTFDVRVTNTGRRYANVGHTVTFTLGHPDPDGSTGIQ